MRIIYPVFISFYTLGIRFASLFSSKAKKWVLGRKNWREELKEKLDPQKKTIWFHCASLGEFEQGRPLIERIRKEMPDTFLLLTFFSPSGYEIRKNFAHVNHVCYLPSDTYRNSFDFVKEVNPVLTFFIKYDLWPNYLSQLQVQKRPVFLVSARLTEKSGFIKWPVRRFYKKAFSAFEHVFCQNEETRELLKEVVDAGRSSVCGDTRFDRVLQLLKEKKEIKEVQNFVGQDFCVIAGSTWQPDEKVLFEVIERLAPRKIKWIIAPHEIDKERIGKRIAEKPSKRTSFSGLVECTDEHNELWIDNIGMLSQLYQYSSVVFIGGGFGSGIHNIQEPAVYGNPVAFGPRFRGFQEAIDLVDRGGANSIANPEELEVFILRYSDHPEKLAEVQKENSQYIQSEGGATDKIMNHLTQHEWL